MQELFESFTQAFRENSGELDFLSFEKIAQKNSLFINDATTIFLLLQASGYPIEETVSGYRLKTYFTPHQEGVYTVVDIETNGSKPENSQIIEIGAVKMKNGEIIDRLETLVQSTFIPENITNLTGIKTEDLRNAPTRQKVLREFKEFLGDTIFVAHDAKFDYSFLNASFNRAGLGSIGNQTICTIELAQRTFKSPKYGLAYLNDFLNLGMRSHHRAFNDAIAASRILKQSLKKIPKHIKTVDDLVQFTQST